MAIVLLLCFQSSYSWRGFTDKTEPETGTSSFYSGLQRQVMQGESRCIRVTLGNWLRGSKRDQREYVWSGRDSIKYGKVILVLILQLPRLVSQSDEIRYWLGWSSQVIFKERDWLRVTIL